jgi:hypothetical protein
VDFPSKFGKVNYNSEHRLVNIIDPSCIVLGVVLMWLHTFAHVGADTTEEELLGGREQRVAPLSMQNTMQQLTEVNSKKARKNIEKNFEEFVNTKEEMAKSLRRTVKQLAKAKHILEDIEQQ